MTENAATQPRKRGGQPGNRNAVKHGFYARGLPEDLSSELPPANSLNDEIAMMRLSIRNILEQSKGPLSVEMELELLRSISLAAAAINRLIRTQRFLGNVEHYGLKLMKAAVADIKADYRARGIATIFDDLN